MLDECHDIEAEVVGRLSSPLKNSIRCATAVSAVRETSSLANFGTADIAVAHISNRLIGSV